MNADARITYARGVQADGDVEAALNALAILLTVVDEQQRREAQPKKERSSSFSPSFSQGLEHSARVAAARKILAERRSYPDDLATAHQQIAMLAAALETVLTHVDELVAIVNEQVQRP
jgi:hypothetical protein